MQQNERSIANGLDCVHPKIKSNKPNQSLNWNCLPTQFQSRLERDTKKCFMPNCKWSINKNINIKIKLDWTDVIPTQNTKSKRIGLCNVIQKQHLKTKKSMSKLLDHAVSVSLGERHKTISMSGLTLWIKNNNININDLKRMDIIHNQHSTLSTFWIEQVDN